MISNLYMLSCITKYCIALQEKKHQWLLIRWL